jgi:alkanesulfonate monooxygenase SsuD/methylene tetrahydromethanopterin reductase-like flavin-dependent oxidoreductase (luciferase family)
MSTESVERPVTVGIALGLQNPAPWRVGWNAVYQEALDFTRQAEAAGIDYIWLSEHHFVDDGYCPSVMPVAAAVATRTTRIRIGTKVMLLPFHDPVRLAEDVAVVDVLSGGRLELGLAAGYRRAEFDGFAIPRAERGARMRESLDVLTRALRAEPFTHRGRFHNYGEVRIVPPPIQRPIPLWLGGRTPAAIGRAARRGAHLALADFVLEHCEADYAVYAAALQAAGRDLRECEVAAVATVFLDEDPERAWREARPHVLYQQNQYQQWFREAADRPTDDFDLAAGEADLGSGSVLVGAPEDVLERIRRFHARVPFTHFSFWCLLPGMRLEPALRSLRLFVERVLPGVRQLRPASEPAPAQREPAERKEG